MKILFLDDDNYRFSLFKRENPNVDVDWAINYETGVNYVRNNNYDVIYLDHDLGWYEPTGKDFVNYMIKNKIPAKLVICHSMNPVGRENMVSMLSSYGYNVINRPFAWTHSTNDIFSSAI